MNGLGKRIFGLCASTFGLTRRLQGPRAMILNIPAIIPAGASLATQGPRITDDGLLQLISQLQTQYTLLHVDEWLGLAATPLARRERIACLTFDDGSENCHDLAFPVLTARRAPASIYVSPSRIADQAGRGLLTAHHMLTMTATGLVRFGARCTPDEVDVNDPEALSLWMSALHDGLASRKGLAFNHLVSHALPPEHVADAAAQAGFHGALCNTPGYASWHGAQRFRLPRITLTETLARDPSLFHYRLLRALTQGNTPPH